MVAPRNCEASPSLRPHEVRASQFSAFETVVGERRIAQAAIGEGGVCCNVARYGFHANYCKNAWEELSIASFTIEGGGLRCDDYSWPAMDPDFRRAKPVV